MKKMAYIVSIKYAPGLHKEFTLIGRKLKEHGVQVTYLLSKHYRWMHKELLNETYFITKSSNWLTILMDSMEFFLWRWMWLLLLFKKQKPGFLCVYNPHPVNFAIARLAKYFCPEGIRAIYLHEPAKADKAVYGWKGRFLFEMVELSQKLTVASCTDVLLPSPVAMELFRKYFPTYHGRIHHTHLLIPDCPYKTERKRKYFSMVGRFNFSKRLDALVNVANYAAERGEDFQFQVVTASNIDEYVGRLTPTAKAKVRIINHSEISDEEISQAMVQSFAVLCLHPVVTQSGVVPVAFMNGTPVIARSSPGFTQFIKHGSNGWLVGDCFSVDELIGAMKSVMNNFDSLSANARQTYLDLFAGRNWKKNYAWLLESLTKV